MRHDNNIFHTNYAKKKFFQKRKGLCEIFNLQIGQIREENSSVGLSDPAITLFYPNPCWSTFIPSRYTPNAMVLHGPTGRRRQIIHRPPPYVPLFREHHVIGRSPAVPSQICCLLTSFMGQHMITLGRATRGGAPCSTSCVERSDWSGRPVAVQNGDDPTNARPGGTPSGQARVGLP